MAVIQGRVFLEHLVAVGVIGPGDKITRVVIDAPFDGSVVIYVERLGDERLLAVAPTLSGVAITTTEAATIRGVDS
jgi:hypothetical protein